MSVIGELARFVREASVQSLTQDERAMLARHTADIAIAGIAGARTHEAKALRALAPQARGDEAIAIAAAVVRHTEVDDIHLPSCTTPGSVTVPAALMLAARQGDFDAARIADAIWIGTELVTRFGIAIDGPNALYRGVWPTCVAAPLGVAAVAARLWGLDQAKTEDALSLALMLMGGRTGRFAGALSGRWILFIGAVAEGLRAAHAAQAGFCGDASLLDGPWLEKAQGIPADVARLTSGLGQSSIYPTLSMKPFCTARQALGAADAFMQLLDEGLDPNTVESVLVRVPQTYAGMISQPIHASNRSSGFVSAGFQMGLAAFARESLWDLERGPSVMTNAKVLAFAARTTVVAEAALQAEFPTRWPATIEVSAGGKTLTRTVLSVIGDPGRRLGDDDVARKAERILTPLVGTSQTAETIATAMHGLETSANAKRLAEMFAAAMGA